MYRRVRSLRRRVLWIATVIAAAAAIRFGPYLLRPKAPETLAEGSYSVERVERDALVLDNGARVCLIGVSIDPADDRTAAFIEGLLKPSPDGAKGSASTTHEDNLSATVRLEFDRERVDRAGRFHAYVWAGDKLLNEEVLLAGCGRVDLQSRYNQSKKTRFRRAEQAAKSAGLGRWAEQ